jgi:Cu-Zn family superoxide dismutase
MQFNKWRPTFIAILTAVLLIVVGRTVITWAANEATGSNMPQAPTKAVCVVHPLGDSGVKGKITFTQHVDGVEIVAELTGLAPGKHGFHVHEFGDCSMMDGTCAGGHFNPEGTPHGGPDSAQRHIGDLGNVEADETGRAIYKRIDQLVALSGPNSIIGRSIIVHADPDDLTSQPTGNAGARVGCGVIGIGDPNMDM